MRLDSITVTLLSLPVMSLKSHLLSLLAFLALGWSLTGLAQPVGQPINIAEHHATGDTFMGIQLLGSLSLKGTPALAELSGLAWDEDEQRLLAISDRGLLLHLIPEIRDGVLTQVELLKALPLLDRQDNRLPKAWRDAEGLSLEGSNNGIQGDTTLLISFERHHRIDRYNPEGHWLSRAPLPELLNEPGYVPASNRGLEAVTLHPKWGLITGPENPPKGTSPYLINGKGRRWLFSYQEPTGALVALETLPDGDLLLLERAYTSIFSPWIISLSRIRADALPLGQRVESRLIARFDSGEGWLTQNMEGLTRHRGMRFFMVSDDGNMPWAQTQLIYFRLVND